MVTRNAFFSPGLLTDGLLGKTHRYRGPACTHGQLEIRPAVCCSTLLLKEISASTVPLSSESTRWRSLQANKPLQLLLWTSLRHLGLPCSHVLNITCGSIYQCAYVGPPSFHRCMQTVTSTQSDYWWSCKSHSERNKSVEFPCCGCGATQCRDPLISAWFFFIYGPQNLHQDLGLSVHPYRLLSIQKRKPHQSWLISPSNLRMERFLPSRSVILRPVWNQLQRLLRSVGYRSRFMIPVFALNISSTCIKAY